MRAPAPRANLAGTIHGSYFPIYAQGKILGVNREEVRIKDGAPGGTRTPNLLIRSQKLYPIELRTQLGDEITVGGKRKLLHRSVDPQSKYKKSGRL